jgi:hypothetical protein
MIKADIANLAWSLSNLREFEKMAADRERASGKMVKRPSCRA